MDKESSIDNTKKRKRQLPPKFPHLHPTQAKKLKRTWVEKKKVQRSYKLLKKREIYRGSGANVTGDGENDAGWPKRDGASPKDDPDPGNADDTPYPKKQNVEPTSSGQAIIETNSRSSNRKGKQREIDQPKPTSVTVINKSGQEGSKESEQARLRQLVKQAYAPTSLHSFKSGSAHRQNHTGFDRGHSKMGRGGGRGQPNMKLRMGALLEQIKRSAKAED